MGGDDITPPSRPSTTGTASTAHPPPPKQQQPSQLLGGLDFFGAPPERPSSASSTNKSTGISRPDLKQSILSLYATAPKPQPATQIQHERQSSLGGTQPSKASAFGDLSDAFGGLDFNSKSATSTKTNQTSSPQPQPSLFPSFSGSSVQSKASPAPPQFTSPAQSVSRPPLAGGSFFDAGPKPPPKPVQAKQAAPLPLVVRKASNASDGFGEFNSAFNPSVPNTAPITASSIAVSTNGLLDLSSSPPYASSSDKPAPPSQQTQSIFNLSAPKAAPASNYNALMQSSAPPSKTTFKSLAADPWAPNEWNTNEPAVATPVTGFSMTSPSLKSATGADFGWGSSPPPKSNTTTTNTQADWSKPVASQPNWNTTTTTSAPVSTQQAGWGSVADIGGWGDPTPPPSTTIAGFGSNPAPPKITPEDDFGDWGSAPSPASVPRTNPSTTAAAVPKATSEDLFGNVWE